MIGNLIGRKILTPNTTAKLISIQQEDEWRIQRGDPQHVPNEEVRLEDPAPPPELEEDEESKAAKQEELRKKEARSRKMLATSATTPEWLKEKFPVPNDVICSHVLHKTGTLPHFQMRFQNGQSFDGKSLGQ